MLSSAEDDEVARVVVERVAIDVVDDLVRCELPPFALLDDVSVFGDLHAVHRRCTDSRPLSSPSPALRRLCPRGTFVAFPGGAVLSAFPHPQAQVVSAFITHYGCG